MGSSDRLAKSAAKLLKLARMNADEINSGLAAIRVSRDSTEIALAQLDHGILQERRRAEQQARGDKAAIETTMSAFTDRIRVKRTNMLATLDQLAARETQMKDDLSAAFTEIKKLEHLLEISERDLSKSKDRRNQAAQNDMISVRYGQG